MMSVYLSFKCSRLTHKLSQSVAMDNERAISPLATSEWDEGEERRFSSRGLPWREHSGTKHAIVRRDRGKAGSNGLYIRFRLGTGLGSTCQ